MKEYSEEWAKKLIAEGRKYRKEMGLPEFNNIALGTPGHGRQMQPRGTEATPAVQPYHLIFNMRLEDYSCNVVMDFAVMGGGCDEALKLAADMEQKASGYIKVIYSSGKVNVEITPNKYFGSAKLTNFWHYDETLGEYVAKSYNQFCRELFAKLGEKNSTFEGLSYGVISEDDAAKIEE
ncbi:MAG: hypothetical protein ACK5LX_11655 [Oscillospiraceae bacterium]